MNTALFVGSATGLVASLLWWLASYKLVSVKHITANFGDLSPAWDAGVRIAGMAILAVAVLLPGIQCHRQKMRSAFGPKRAAATGSKRAT